MHYFLTLFGKEIHLIRTDLPSISIGGSKTR